MCNLRFAVPAHIVPPTRVMLIAHSHEDPGWTQTIDEYYHGYDKYHYGVRLWPSLFL